MKLFSKAIPNTEAEPKTPSRVGAWLGVVDSGDGWSLEIKPSTMQANPKHWDRVVIPGEGNQPPTYLGVAEFYQQQAHRKDAMRTGLFFRLGRRMTTWIKEWAEKL